MAVLSLKKGSKMKKVPMINELGLTVMPGKQIFIRTVAALACIILAGSLFFAIDSLITVVAL